jgi:N-acetylglucosaminyldiphosphoundecaprenol N-acetyl-beta-D-mannosaminyltransferase
MVAGRIGVATAFDSSGLLYRLHGFPSRSRRGSSEFVQLRHLRCSPSQMCHNARGLILGTLVDRTNYEHVADVVLCWAQRGLSKYICIATVNNVMEAYDCSDFQRVMNGADLVTPDGMPLVWGLRLLGHKSATRVYGPDLSPMVLKMSEVNCVPVGFYGGRPETLHRLLRVVGQRFPDLKVAFSFSPPFRGLNTNEDQRIIDEINRSGARILFVGLSTPKQDYWMAEHKDKVHSVMIGVGAAFDFLAGTKRQAPRWMMRIGMEWFFRLLTEPRRLWKRYLKHNPRFVILFALQLLRAKFRSVRSSES